MAGLSSPSRRPGMCSCCPAEEKAGRPANEKTADTPPTATGTSNQGKSRLSPSRGGVCSTCRQTRGSDIR